MCDESNAPSVAEPVVLDVRNQRAGYDWACAGAWCCLGAMLAFIVPFLILDGLTMHTVLPPHGKPSVFVMADTIGAHYGYLMILPLVGLLLACVSLRGAGRPAARTSTLAVLLNLAVLAAFLLAAATI